MKILSIATLVLTLTASIAANAALKVGDTLVLKKDLQSINEISVLVNGEEDLTVRPYKGTGSGCGITFSDRGHSSNPTYSKGTVFTVKSVEKTLSKSDFLVTLYSGVIHIELQPKDGASEEAVGLGCATEDYMSKITAGLKTPSSKNVLEVFNDLF